MNNKISASQQARILLIEDDPQISKSLKFNLGFNAFEVQTADSLAEAQVKMDQLAFDVLLLDVGLPDGTGIEFCQKLRQRGNTVPILFLSARTDEETVVKGIVAGGDDYIRKPFGIEELKVRINKILGRSEKRQLLQVGQLTLDIKQRSVMLADQLVTLGKREFDILTILVKNAGDIVARETILTLLDEKSEVYDRTIDSHISHLRRKMRASGQSDIEITSIYGVGYRLSAREVA